MNKLYKEKFPEWCNDKENNYELILSNDCDSILVENFLRQTKRYQTKFYYTFNNLFVEKGHTRKDSIIGCDIDFIDGRCWGNHVTALNKAEINPNSANLNNTELITRANYTDKFAGSTLIQVLSYYDVDISNLSEEGKALLLCIDSHYTGFYDDRFNETQRKWLVDVLEYPELYDIILRYTKQDFINLQEKYKMNKNGKIWLKPVEENTYILQTNINLIGISNVLNVDITLPDIKLEKNLSGNVEMQSAYAKTRGVYSRKHIHNRIVSYAQTYYNTASYTYLVDKN